jgi:6-pyruvoyl-tetrahydropterin synthase
MKHMDWAAMGMASGAYGAASSAYAEASRARAEVAALWEENQRLREDLDSQKYEREFQKWAEEMIYQFAKTVKAITDTPGEPVNDFIDLASFLHLIEAKELDTSHINGFDHKEKFDETLIKAQNLLTKLETNEQVQKYIREQEAARLEQDRKENENRREQERRQAEKTAKEAATAHRRVIQLVSIFGLSILVFIMSALVDFGPGVFVTIAGFGLFLYLLRKHWTN